MQLPRDLPLDIFLAYKQPEEHHANQNDPLDQFRHLRAHAAYGQAVLQERQHQRAYDHLVEFAARAASNGNAAHKHRDHDLKFKEVAHRRGNPTDAAYRKYPDHSGHRS